MVMLAALLHRATGWEDNAWSKERDTVYKRVFLKYVSEKCSAFNTASAWVKKTGVKSENLNGRFTENLGE